MDYNSLSHTKWNCKYHVVFAPKYRRQVIYGKLKGEIGQILRKLCEQKGIEIYRSECMFRSYPHVDQYSTKNECVISNRVFEREKLTDDL